MSTRTEAASLNPRQDPHRIRQHGEDRSPGERLLGRADPALAAALQHRTRHHAAGADPRLRHPQEGLRAGESGSGQASRRHSETHRAGRRRSHRRQTQRPVPAAHLADRQRHPDQHERERSHLQPRDRNCRRRDGIEEAGPSQRSRQHVAVLERHVSGGHAHRSRRSREERADPRHQDRAPTRSQPRRKNSTASSRSAAPTCRMPCPSPSARNSAAGPACSSATSIDWSKCWTGSTIWPSAERPSARD